MNMKTHLKFWLPFEDYEAEIVISYLLTQMNSTRIFDKANISFGAGKISPWNLGLKLKLLHRRLRNVDGKINEK